MVTQRDAYIVLNMMQGIGPVTVRTLAAALGSVEAILGADRESLLAVPGIGPETAKRILDQRGRLDPVAECAKAEGAGARIVTAVDPEYPRPLLTIYDPPLALYVQGELETRDEHAVALVGTRHPSHYGRETAERLGMHLAQHGFTVVSGLARGIDTAAHRGALQGKGRTLAVLGGGLDCLYPPENKELAGLIAAQGAVTTEYPFGREPDKTTFPVRNRIVSGLSKGVVVVEAPLTSGAMITAGQAAEQGRTVFAVPGRVDAPGARGPHQLLRNGARLVESVEDILQEFEMLIPVRPAGDAPRPRWTDSEAALMKAIGDEGEIDLDSLTRCTGMKASEVSAVLIGLEMKRAVRMLPGRRVALRRA